MSAKRLPIFGRLVPTSWQVLAGAVSPCQVLSGLVTLSAMVGDFSEAQLHAQVRLACGRIAGGAVAIVEAHHHGVVEGPH